MNWLQRAGVKLASNMLDICGYFAFTPAVSKVVMMLTTFTTDPLGSVLLPVKLQKRGLRMKIATA